MHKTLIQLVLLLILILIIFFIYNQYFYKEDVVDEVKNPPSMSKEIEEINELFLRHFDFNIGFIDSETSLSLRLAEYFLKIPSFNKTSEKKNITFRTSKNNILAPDTVVLLDKEFNIYPMYPLIQRRFCNLHSGYHFYTFHGYKKSGSIYTYNCYRNEDCTLNFSNSDDIFVDIEEFFSDIIKINPIMAKSIEFVNFSPSDN